jgi:hypothetical protein
MNRRLFLNRIASLGGLSLVTSRPAQSQQYHHLLGPYAATQAIRKSGKGYPAWRNGMALNQVNPIPSTQPSLYDLRSSWDASPPGWHPLTVIGGASWGRQSFEDYGGNGYDPIGNKIYNGLTGGHASLMSNQVNMLDLNLDTPVWARLRESNYYDGHDIGQNRSPSQISLNNRYLIPPWGRLDRADYWYVPAPLKAGDLFTPYVGAPVARHNYYSTHVPYVNGKPLLMWLDSSAAGYEAGGGGGTGVQPGNNVDAFHIGSDGSGIVNDYDPKGTWPSNPTGGTPGQAYAIDRRNNTI